MREAVIVSTARTPIGVAFKGALNNIKSPTPMAHAIGHAVARAGIDPGAIDDVVIGSVLTVGTAGMNVARLSALAAGLPTTVPGQTIDRVFFGLNGYRHRRQTDHVRWTDDRGGRWTREYLSGSECLSEMGGR